MILHLIRSVLGEPLTAFLPCFPSHLSRSSPLGRSSSCSHEKGDRRPVLMSSPVLSICSLRNMSALTLSGLGAQSAHSACVPACLPAFLPLCHRHGAIFLATAADSLTLSFISHSLYVPLYPSLSPSLSLYSPRLILQVDTLSMEAQVRTYMLLLPFKYASFLFFSCQGA